MAPKAVLFVQARNERDEKRRAKLRADLASKSEKEDAKVGAHVSFICNENLGMK
jgi:hypothetical protein